MPVEVVYYNGAKAATKAAVQGVCKQLQMNGGLLDRIPEPEQSRFFYNADRWTEEKLQSFYQVPFRKITIRVLDSTGGFSLVEDYPPAVKEIALYRAVALIITSEYFESEPNKSEAAQKMEQMIDERVLEARHRLRLRTGARHKHSNPFMPPEVAPKVNEEKERLS